MDRALFTFLLCFLILDVFAFEFESETKVNTSDVILIKNELTKLIDFFKLSHQVRKTLIRLGMFSITYNIICGSLAILGYMSPLFAAVLMPISSVIVSLIVLFNLREKQWK